MIQKSLVSFLMLAVLTVLSGLAIVKDDHQDAKGAPPVRFEPVEVWIDSGAQSLAAYQLELQAIRGNVKIVGIEGGAHPMFAEPPYYDPAAMQQERVIIAAFSTAKPENLPTGRTRIATIHVQVSGDVAPEFESKLSVAADASGETIPADMTIVKRNPS